MTTKILEKQVAAELVNSLTNSPRSWKWRNADCDMVLGPGGIVMSANYLIVYDPVKVRFGFWNRRKIRRALRRWKTALGNDLAAAERGKALLVIHRCLTGQIMRAAA